MTAGIFDGGFVTISVDAAVIECLTDCTLNFSVEEIDITCKNTAGTKDTKLGASEWSIDFSGNYKEDGSGTQFMDLFALSNNRTTFDVTFGSTATGDKSYGGEGVIPSISVSAPNTGGLVTFSGTIKGKGVLTETTNA
jgi:predicted secreted protein